MMNQICIAIQKKFAFDIIIALILK
jgi:hypothetical protein